MGFIIMEPEDTPPMSGSNCICVATVLLDAGIIPMTEPETRLVLEAPAGLVEVTAQCSNGKAQSITLKNVPAFAERLGVPLEVEGLGTITVDTAFGGDSFVMADAKALGLCHDARRGARPRRDRPQDREGGERAAGLHPSGPARLEALLLRLPDRAAGDAWTAACRAAMPAW